MPFTELAILQWTGRMVIPIAVAILLAVGPGRAKLGAANGDDNAKLVQDVLDRVPSDAGLFAHGRPSDLWNTPLVKQIRTAVGTEGEQALKELEAMLGIGVDMVDTVTFYYPRMPQGPGDEKSFVVAVVTKKPYAKEKILIKLRAKGADDTEEMVKLQDGFVLHFTSQRTYAVMHKSLVEKYAKGPIKEPKSGPISDALKLASEKHGLVAGWNLGALPNELVTGLENQPETRSFSPLYKARAATLIADLDKNLTIDVRFACDSANAAVDAERCIGLLLKLAGAGLESLTKQKKEDTDWLAPVLPFLKEVDKSIKGVKTTANGMEARAILSMRADLPVAEPIKMLLAKARESSARAQSINNLKQIALAMHNYHNTHNGFPPAAICDKKGKPLLSWRVALLPYLEQQDLYNQFKLDEPWDSEHNIKLAKKTVSVYMTPGVTKPGESNYRIFTGNGAVFDTIQQSRLQDITDGTSNTLMVIQAAEGVPWSKPDDLPFDPDKDAKKLLLWQNDITIGAMCDGSVRSFSKKMSEKTWKLIIQKADGQVLPDDF